MDIPLQFRNWTSKKHLNLINSIVSYLIGQLEPRSYHVWLNNLFSSVPLMKSLANMGIAATGTARTNSGLCRDLIELKRSDHKDSIQWGDTEIRVVSDGDVNCYAWKDNAIVLMFTNAFPVKPLDGFTTELTIC